MLHTILNTAITFIISGVLGYCVSLIKNYKGKLKEKQNNESIQNIALLTMLQSQLTNTYFVYEKMGAIPDYIYRNWLNMLSIYEKLGGNDYVHVLAQKMKTWEIIKTDIIKQG